MMHTKEYSLPSSQYREGNSDRRMRINTAAKRRRSRRIAADALFLLPAFLLFTTFVIYPALSSFYYSLTDWNGLNPNINFIGLENFRQLFSSSELFNGTKNTLTFAFFVMIFQNGIALVLALALNRLSRAVAFARVVFLLPALLSALAIGYIWSYMYNPLFGYINNFLTAIHLSNWTQDWLGDSHFALGSVIFTNTWQWVGYSMIIFLAGLQMVPPEMYEAAHMDGASSWQRFRHITMPLIVPAITVNVILTLIGSLKVFDIIFVMTEGGPGRATESWAFQLYDDAFSQNHFGYATALGVVMSLVILLISVVSLRLLRKREVVY